MWEQLHSQLNRTRTGLQSRMRRLSPGQRRAVSILIALMIVSLFGVAAALPRITSAAETNVLGNGGFEHGFVSIPGCGDVGAQWGCFTNGGAANYGFYDDQWAPVVAEGKHSQLIEINTKGIDAPSNDRYAGLAQVARVMPGARYQFSLRGMIRTTNMDGDPYRYVVQVGWIDGAHGDWKSVNNWTDVGWYTYYSRTEPGSLSNFQTSLVPNSNTVTVFVRVWKKWGMANEEIDVNLDDIALVGPPAYGLPGGRPGIGGPVSPQPHGPVAPAPQPAAPTYWPAAEETLACVGPDLVYNGSFEHGFNSTPLGDVAKGWGAFTNGGAAAYGFYDEQWDVVVADGNHGQLIEINTKGIYPADADRYAGLYQRIAGLHPGATYELTLRGLLRGVGNEAEPYRFAAQWGIAPDADWRSVDEWTEMDLGPIWVRTEPGPMAQYKVRFTAPAPSVVLFIRGWNKWAVTDVELDFNLDAIRVNACVPAGPSHDPVGPGPVGPGPVGPGVGGPVGGGSCAYTVKPGDVLSVIAQRFGVSTDMIIRANGIRNANMIYAGQVLDIPGCGGSAPAAQNTTPVVRTPQQGPSAPQQPTQAGPSRGQPAQPAQPSGERTYTVQRGDMLGHIAQRFGVDVNRLAAYNGIRNANMIYVGQVLRIPSN